jgi:hypothetical protein
VSDEPISDTFRENVTVLMKWAGFDFATLPDGEPKDALIEWCCRAFDFYTRQGHDFGNAACMVAEQLAKQVFDAR